MMNDDRCFALKKILPPIAVISTIVVVSIGLAVSLAVLFKKSPAEISFKPIYFSSGSMIVFFEFETELVEKKVSYYLVKAGWSEIDVYQFHDKIRGEGKGKVFFLSQEEDIIVVKKDNVFIGRFNVAEWEGDETVKFMEFFRENF